VVLGTGAADGIPQPFCDCTTCTDARRQGYSRFGGGVLIDDTLLIDAPSSTSAAAARARVDLRGVRVIAVTHAHHDHWDPAILLHRQWILDRGEPLPPLTLIGPPTVLETARGWLPPGSDVTLVPAVAGATHEMAGMRLRVVPSTHGRTIPGKASDPWADEAVLFEVRSGDASLLYATDTGLPDDALLAAVTGADYHTVLLELTFGDHTGVGALPTPGHLAHDTFYETLAMLRRVGAVTENTDVIAVHLGHHNPPQSQLSRDLASWGARLVDDGTVLEVGAGRRRASCRLVTGGARSGKSRYAERIAQAGYRPVTYIATGYPASPDDAEWAARIELHRRRRPASWRTVESADPAATITATPDGGTVIVDCLALWLTRLVDGVAGWTDPIAAESAVEDALGTFTDALRTALERDVEILLVTNEVGSGVVPDHAAGRLFRDLLGTVNATLARECDTTVLLVAGQPLELERNRHVDLG